MRSPGSGRQIADIDLVGTYQDVAAKMSEVIDEVGGDGFLIMNGELTRRLRDGDHRRPRPGTATARRCPQALRT